MSLYQRGEDGFPVGSDKGLREGYGPIPDAEVFQKGSGGHAAPVEIHGWQWSSTFNRWSALVTFDDGWKGFTYPFPVSLDKSLPAPNFFNLEEGKMKVLDWDSAKELPDFAGVTFDPSNKMYLMTGMVGDERAVNYLLANNYLDACKEAEDVSMTRLWAHVGFDGDAHELAKNCGSYEGRVVAETPLHVMQDVGRRVMVIHDRRELDMQPKEGDRISVKYKDGRGQVSSLVRDLGKGAER